MIWKCLKCAKMIRLPEIAVSIRSAFLIKTWHFSNKIQKSENYNNTVGLFFSFSSIDPPEANLNFRHFRHFFEWFDFAQKDPAT